MMSLIYTMQILFQNIYISINKNTKVSLIELLSINRFQFYQLYYIYVSYRDNNKIRRKIDFLTFSIRVIILYTYMLIIQRTQVIKKLDDYIGCQFFPLPTVYVIKSYRNIIKGTLCMIVVVRIVIHPTCAVMLLIYKYLTLINYDIICLKNKDKHVRRT